jgi:hypothetical protein
MYYVRTLRFLLATALVMTLTMLFPSAIRSNSHTEPSLTHGTVTLELRVRTERRQYAVGEPICVQIQITQTPANALGILYDAPWVLTKLEITDSAGTPVVQQHYRASNGIENPFPYEYPNGVLALQNIKWFNISHWGYRIQKPGDYQVRLAPFVQDLVVSGGARPAIAFDRPSFAFKVLPATSDDSNGP